VVEAAGSLASSDAAARHPPNQPNAGLESANRYAREQAIEFGCMMSINPDAHSISELDHMHWGVEMARKGGVPADRVLNAMTLAGITSYLRLRRRQFRPAA
jgi:hypothetical protein